MNEADLVIEVGQVPIPVRKEQNRYMLNSWLVPPMTSTLSPVVSGVSTAEDVERTYLIANAAHIKERFLDRGPQENSGGEGFHKYPNAAYSDAGYLAVPAAPSVPELVSRAMLK